MDEVNHGSRPKRTRALRAADVIPPFDQQVQPADDSAMGEEQSETLPPQADNNESGSEGCFAPDAAGAMAASLPAGEVEIPAYDLAENILAEQRRAAGRRRRRPGRAEDEPLASPREAVARASAPDWGSQDLLELQRIVAEIVARDIERLCRRPERPVPARP